MVGKIGVLLWASRLVGRNLAHGPEGVEVIAVLHVGSEILRHVDAHRVSVEEPTDAVAVHLAAEISQVERVALQSHRAFHARACAVAVVVA